MDGQRAVGRSMRVSAPEAFACLAALVNPFGGDVIGHGLSSSSRTRMLVLARSPHPPKLPTDPRRAAVI
jgi:hypothetical protein